MIIGINGDHTTHPPYLMSGANPSAESHYDKPITISDDNLDCTPIPLAMLCHMPNALIPVHHFTHYFSSTFNTYTEFPPDFFTTVRGLDSALQTTKTMAPGKQRDFMLFNEIGARGGTIPIGKGEHATELKPMFNEDELHDWGFWEDLDREWYEGPWADWGVDDKGREHVPDPHRRQVRIEAHMLG